MAVLGLGQPPPGEMKGDRPRSSADDPLSKAAVAAISFEGYNVTYTSRRDNSLGFTAQHHRSANTDDSGICSPRVTLLAIWVFIWQRLTTYLKVGEAARKGRLSVSTGQVDSNFTPST